jgi:hypothetical protein
MRKIRFIGQAEARMVPSGSVRLQPAQNCEIEQFWGGGMKQSQCWIVAAYANAHFCELKRAGN